MSQDDYKLSKVHEALMKANEQFQNMTPEEKEEWSNQLKATLQAKEEEKKLEAFKKNPRNWIGVCNNPNCQGEVVAAQKSILLSEMRFGPKQASTYVSHFYCKNCLLMYHSCPNKKKL